MKQFSRKLSTYSPDWAGVCSAFYELGGMQVIHDASGCNSTYTTFDEPRWYDMDSNFFISGLLEMDAILGQGDDKLIQDIISAAQQLSPAFISLAGSPIPMMTGTDFSGIASLLERRTGIPSFGFATNGMGDYIKGASLAMKAIAKRFCPEEIRPIPYRKGQPLAVNILGATPLDFSITGNVDALKDWLTYQGGDLVSCWTMGSSLGDISQAGKGHVNLVVSGCGLPAAKVLRQKYGTPYVVGIPVGDQASQQLYTLLEQAAQSKENILYFGAKIPKSGKKVIIIGEQVWGNSLRTCLQAEHSLFNVTVLSPLTEEKELQLPGDLATNAEEEIQFLLENYDIIIADPIYQRILPRPESQLFIGMPHEAFSSRLYREQIPIVIGKGANQYLSQYL